MEKVRSGEQVRISAATWNAFIDAANYVKESRQNSHGKGLKSGIQTGIVLVKNAESEPRERFAALVLCDIAVPPNLNEDEFLSCAPVFVGQKMTEEREGKPYAILLEPLAHDQIGRAMVLGIVPAKVTIQDADERREDSVESRRRGFPMVPPPARRRGVGLGRGEGVHVQGVRRDGEGRLPGDRVSQRTRRHGAHGVVGALRPRPRARRGSAVGRVAHRPQVRAQGDGRERLMGFQYVPSLFRTPAYPGFTPPDGIWRGKGLDEGLYSFKVSSQWGGHVIVRDANLFPSLQIDGSKLAPVFTDVNGYMYWQGNGYVYCTKTYGWVWCSVFPGYEPVENHKFSDGDVEWTGDTFYSFSAPPSGPENTVQMRPRGAAYANGSAKSLKATWPRWAAKSGEFGVYEGKDGESGEKVKGLPQFKGAGETFLRSLNKDKGHYTYGRIHYASGKWVIGETGSAGGWHEGSEPNAGGGSVTFKFTKPEGSDAQGTDIAVSFDKYVCGEETETAYLGSVAIWR